MLDRRGFLGLSLGGALAAPRALPRWLESALGTMSSGERWLVVLELAGGNDGLVGSPGTELEFAL